MRFKGLVTANLFRVYPSAYFLNWSQICTFIHQTEARFSHVTRAEMRALKNLLSDCWCSCLYMNHLNTHTNTHTYIQGSAIENPHLIEGGKLLTLSFSLYLPPFLFLKSCNTGEKCKPWSGNGGFSQWEHSVTPAGLCRRVNTFSSQARNSLAGEREAGREGGETEKEESMQADVEEVLASIT